MKYFNILTLLFKIWLLNETTVFACDYVMSYKDSMYRFQSPDYPKSIGVNDSLICTLKVEHAPSIEEALAEAANAACNDSSNGNGSNGGDENGNGNDSGNGQGTGAICQVMV